MNNTVKKKHYVQQAKTTVISATSRSAVKVKDNFYTVESHEERTVPEGADLDKEWEFLWNSVNAITDAQVEDIFKTFNIR